MSHQEHPAVRAAVFAERLWSSDKDQAHQRAHVVVCALADAGFLSDCEVVKGMAMLRKNEPPQYPVEIVRIPPATVSTIVPHGAYTDEQLRDAFIRAGWFDLVDNLPPDVAEKFEGPTWTVYRKSDFTEPKASVPEGAFSDATQTSMGKHVLFDGLFWRNPAIRFP